MIRSLVIVSLAASANASETQDIDFFERKIRPVLVESCYKCHSAGAETVKGGLRLDARDATLKGGESGPAVVPGDAGKSLLISALKYEALEMPPNGQLDAKTIADFVQWIEMGAPDPRNTSVPTPIEAKQPVDWGKATDFWSFRPPQRYPQPNVQQADWIQQPIDAFVLAGLEAAALAPNEAADRQILLRRVSLDLIGLPPSIDEVNEVLRDRSPKAFEHAVERLLGTSHYGERWARMWLDVARYAEDQAHIVGNDKELFYPNAHLYRDWVINAFNSDLPYDQFLRLQLAADLIEPNDGSHRAALGFIGLGPKYYRRNAPDVMAEEWEDRVDTVTRGMLGLTVACARCHNHKYDPIPTEDYYALAGVFAGTEMYNQPLSSTCEVNEKNGQAKKPEEALHIVREATPRDLKVMIRGDVANEGDLVNRGFIRVLNGGERKLFENGSGRAELADAIASPLNPLTARVIVNRVWGELFGKPLVSTPSNFGHLGTRPSHPELLDDLAARFMDNGWSLKWLHRQIVLSATYQQSSRWDASKAAVDPANQWLWRANRRRLSVEAWRDSLLQACGSLDASVGGKSMIPSDPKETRRTIYSAISRFQLDPLLSLLDFPDPNTHSERRSLTTTPIQKLFSMNSSFIVRRAEELAQRIAEQSAKGLDEDVVHVYEAVFARKPDPEEIGLARAYLQSGADRKLQWTKYAQALLASNELLIVD